MKIAKTLDASNNSWKNPEKIPPEKYSRDIQILSSFWRECQSISKPVFGVTLKKNSKKEYMNNP